MQTIIDTLIPILKNAGKIILSSDCEENYDIDVKAGDANFVTVFDVKVQDFIINSIKMQIPDAVFIAEEKENDKESLESEHCFIIDPIDGTTNFIHKYKQSSISLAMFSHGKATIGIVYNPYLDEMFTAVAGRGAYLNGKPIKVSDRNLSDTILGFGTSPYYRNELGEKTLKLMYDIFMHCGDLRRTGSAAIDLANLAAGRIDAFFEFRLSPWDIAAGYLLITEAGGKITDMNGNDIDFSAPSSVIASNKRVYNEILEFTKKYV
jgi:myo-inositol-1(or 4)-monophosphatase